MKITRKNEIISFLILHQTEFVCALPIFAKKDQTSYRRTNSPIEAIRIHELLENTSMMGKIVLFR